MKRAQIIVPKKPPVILYIQKSDPPQPLQSFKISEPTTPRNCPKTARDKQMSMDISEFLYPLKTKTFVAHFKKYLTQYEKTEIRRYQQIYHLRRKIPTSNNAPKKSDKYFQFVLEDHIAYRYEQIQLLGQGSFGNVIRCYDHKDHQNVAIKLIKDSPNTHNQMVLELNILKQLQSNTDSSGASSIQTNNHICQYKDMFMFRGFFCIVMELLSQDVYSVLRSQFYSPFPFDTVRIIALQTACGLSFIHKSKIIHCDIKPENILFTNTRKTSIRICDFGCSCFEGKNIYKYIQSRFYRAPEVVLTIPYGKPIDIWSYGCLLYEIAVGRPLFPAEDEEELLHMMIQCIGPPPEEFIEKVPKSSPYVNHKLHEFKPYRHPTTGKIYSPNTFPIKEKLERMGSKFIDLTLSCLKWNPNDRPTIDEILKHPFFQQTKPGRN